MCADVPGIKSNSGCRTEGLGIDKALNIGEDLDASLKGLFKKFLLRTLQAVLFESCSEDSRDHFVGARFFQKPEQLPFIYRVDRRPQIRISREYQTDAVGRKRLSALQHFESVHKRHSHVRHDYRVWSGRGNLLQRLDRTGCDFQVELPAQ